jgi:2-iminobutanoate/2-iminopropanoate deaminase
MFKLYNSDNGAKPGGAYTHIADIPAGGRLIVLSGQVGVETDGSLPKDFDTQCERAYKNILLHLETAGASAKDIFKFTVFLTRATDIPAYRVVRERIIGNDELPTSTLLVISALAHPDMLVEIEAFAVISG